MRNPSVVTLMRIAPNVEIARALRFTLTAPIDKVEERYADLLTDIRKIIPHRRITETRIRQEVCDSLLKTHGVETIEGHEGKVLIYLNTGESYSPTLLWHYGWKWGRSLTQITVGDWGSWVEKNGKVSV